MEIVLIVVSFFLTTVGDFKITVLTRSKNIKIAEIYIYLLMAISAK